ncbi:MAG TPA: YifB family Mg chelatase-like AAA ATPase [Baekduia sp.]|uniref:YifB family Mg chelatase-like AAA ATPase n=1 Tax=Baekduia sp. TaxID=2600305 RepID=UPI002CC79AD3|nr:YifB family Mg chelatase-like AAA ATPase [Baekduia sp.]HMJ37134.1 YifB family Mg chelatase-like AAA ATPase [Baekduia sp.]
MLAHVTTFAIQGVESRRVTVEVDLRPGLPAFTIVGLGDLAVREARERVRSAILNSGFQFPARRITVNLAPAALRKEGPGFDLAIACGVLAAAGQLPIERLERVAVFGELALGGELRRCRGVLAVAEGTVAAGLRGLVLARTHADEAALVEDLGVLGAANLAEVAAILRGESDGSPPPSGGDDGGGGAEPVARRPDLADVRGHGGPLRALAIAAAGGHNLLLAGPPGTGKTMLAQRLPSILPPLSRAEAIEVTRIQSVAGLRVDGGLVTRRPFRAPHHTISASGLVGGGSNPQPGEATLAHHGVLFLDELAEFGRSALEALRQPLEDGRVAIVRGQRTAVYPTRLMLVASTNPCPCGYAGTPRCRCGEGDIARYRRRLSGPLLDRMDLLVDVQRPTPAEFAAGPVCRSADERERVVAARERQARRLEGTGAACNAHLDAALVRRHVALDAHGASVLRRAYDRGTLSPRGHDRVLRVARTIADLDGSDAVGSEHLLEALGLRQDVIDQPAQDAA